METGGESRSKRKKLDKKGRFAALQKLKELKGSKNKYEISDVDNVYEIVDEKEYTKKVLSRQDEDWIVDDDGSGYVEDGRDIFDDDLDSESIAASSKQTKTSKKRKAVSENAGKGNIQFMLSNIASKKTEERNIGNDDILSELIQEIDESGTDLVQPSKYAKTANNLLDAEKEAERQYMKSFAVPKPSKIVMTKKVSTPVESPKRVLNIDSIKKNSMQNGEYNENEPLEPENTLKICNKESIVEKRIFNPENILKNNVTKDSDSINEQNGVKNSYLQERNENITRKLDDHSISADITACAESLLDDDFDMTVVEDFVDGALEASKPAIEEDEITEEQLLSGWNTLQEGTNNEDITTDVKIDSSDLSLETDSEGNRIFKFYWWDAFEDRKAQPGVVFFFGKTYCEAKKSYVSCCVAVRNVERKIFLLPRQFHQSDPMKPVTLLEVYREFKNVSGNLKLNNFKSKKTEKNYVFDPDVPNHSDYLEVRYSAKSPIIPTEYQSGDTYSKIFGLNTSYLEIILLEQKIKGPSWLQIVNPEPVNNPVSWCKLEVNCIKTGNISIYESDKPLPPPPIVAITINFRTIVSQNKFGAQNEIVMLSCLVQNKYCIDKQVPKPPFQQHFCVLTRPGNMTLPHDMHNALRQYRSTRVQRMDSEKALLNYFIIQFASIDPDLIIGHDLQGYGLDLLCSRLRQCKVSMFSKLSRLRRSEYPQKERFARELFCGRLVCDVKVSARELIRSRSYDLETLCQNVLKIPEDRTYNVKSDALPNMFQSSADILKLVSMTMQDTAYILQMMYELNVIPLALQITNIAGNVMSRTLLGGRSERNEFLLLHAFTEKNYLVPDKRYEKKNQETSAQPAEQSKRKKPTYSGGLVLDPKVGFYDHLILLMDFNSLYPSIIQEYNVCFTTISGNSDGSCNFTTDKSKTIGILPAEIRKLVESRREVKKLLNGDIPAELYMQYNIRQMALKLTANSMYGCLGFSNSRFFAKDLAAFITQKGREILTNTKDTVEKMSLEVIYGDTDSIMINTNSQDYDDVFKIGVKIKQEINKLYRQVELDIDGVFKYLLLLKKKKYAAVTISKNKSGDMKLVQEHKGLDIVRRDWSKLSCECGKAVLNYILSCDTMDEKIENVQNHLSKVKSDLENNAVPLSMLSIVKQLTKNPKEYANKTALPHVQVALRLNQKGGKQLQNGDTVEYIICDDGTNTAATQRAYHIDELNSSETLKVDIQYYLSQQIFPVISRLCEPIPGLDGYQIAMWLGIDAKNYKKPKETTENEDIQYNDTLKYRNCEPFIFYCYSCKAENKVSEPVQNGYNFLNKCANNQCSIRPVEYVNHIANQLTLTMHSYIKKFYKFELTCEDPACLNERNFITVRLVGKHSVCTACKEGVMFLKYTAKDLHMQLSYFQNLFQLTRNGKKVQVDSLTHGYDLLRNTVEKILNRSGFNKINLGEMFAQFIPTKHSQELILLDENEYDSETEDV